MEGDLRGTKESLLYNELEKSPKITVDDQQLKEMNSGKTSSSKGYNKAYSKSPIRKDTAD